MKSDIIIIGGGASGLMAGYAAADTLVEAGAAPSVAVLEKMPRPGRKIMITGKGRCNFSNIKDWNEFSLHIRSNSSFVKPSFFNLSSRAMQEFLESYGLKTVVERGDRAFPQSHRASDVVDTLVNACLSRGVKMETECEIVSISHNGDGFALEAADGRKFACRRLIIATGGLSYPSSGSSGDGYAWASALGHSIKQCLPSLTALVPKGYKDPSGIVSSGMKGHIDRSSPLSEVGKALCGNQLKNVGLSLCIDGKEVDSVFGDVDFTDGGIEGPAGFQLSRKAVKAIFNGSKVSLRLDLKSGVPAEDISRRVNELWDEIRKDPRSERLREKEKCRILLGKLMPWDLIPGFVMCNPRIMNTLSITRGGARTVLMPSEVARALKEWAFDLAGYVGYERAVVTAGGVNTDEVIPKTMESRLVPGLYFCGEVLDIDSDTGGYNLQTAFSTGCLAGRSAARSILRT
ncbi:MAG: aminoacetone oxidase family FAD-binding enzyme [Bacteroidales bacterium]|nr:aminoacetone oxidase family FAD-binding enzyme [Bacteroidales bacterium]